MLALLLPAKVIMAQKNIFRAGDVTITASAALSSGTFSNFNDENLSNFSYFSKPASDQIDITFQCLTPQKLSEYSIVFFAPSYSAKTVVLSGSADGTAWTVLDTKTGSATAINAATTHTASYMYYKFTFKGLEGSLLVINEISAYGDGLSAPTLTATAGSVGNLANLSWTKEIRGVGSYELERSTDRVNFTLLKTMDELVLTYAEETLQRNTAYWYRIRAKKGEVYSAYSVVKEIITANDVIVAAPSLTATASTTLSSTANLSWALPIGGPGTFELERSSNGTDFTLLQSVSKAVTTYVDATLAHNTAYWYRIRGKNDISTSPYSTVRKITTINDALLTAPVLQVTAPTGTQAMLSWTLAFNTEGGFELEKSIDGTNFTPMGKVNKSVSAYTEESLTPNTAYWYRVRAYNYTGTSPYSAVVKVTTNSIKGLPADITDDGGKLTVSAENTGGANGGEGSSKFIDNNIATKWLIFAAQTGQNLSAVYEPKGAYVVTGYTLSTANDASGRDPKNWRFEGSDDNAAWTVLDTRTNQLGAAAERITTYSYQLSSPGTKAFKFYRIAFTSNNGSSDIVRYQMSEWQIMGLDPGSPDIPANLAVTGSTINTISLSWTQDKTIPVKELILQRSQDGLFYEAIDTLESTVASFTDQHLYDGATYYYRLKAVGERATAVSGWSNVATGKTQATAGLPLIPADLIATAIKDTEISLQWKDRSEDETGFLLERSRDQVLFEEVKTLAANTSTYIDQTVWPGTYFYYRVAALKDKTKSAYSNVLKVLTTGINTAPLTTSPLIPRKICTGTGEYSLAFNGVSPGPAFEKIQKLTVTGVKAGDEESKKFFSAYSFNPVVTNGIVNYKVTTTGLAVPGDSALVMVTVKDDGGTVGFASDSTEFLVKVYFTPFTVKIASDKGTGNLSRYTSVNLTASTDFPDQTRYEWADADGIDGARNGIKLLVRPKRTTTYTVTATTPTGCTATASIVLSPQDSLVVANVLTPNRDGKNDTWMIWGIEKLADNEVKVMDRQGRLVFSRKNYNNDWDGSYNGAALPQGGYYYVIETNDGNKPKTGVLTIIK
ncbi:gliding motility-associated C-terminal domain-containing protein [Pedobacter steynii]|uniref:Gliding motility-associated C-terminal domain-containing protein n=1 Tax=Pedobacter steynii TaxID=430522 RepID=A0A1G9UCD4_9SPHI|nr:gliding motility-associated C-terminal domain-containing protein [Pedobacter steynii]